MIFMITASNTASATCDELLPNFCIAIISATKFVKAIFHTLAAL